MENRAHQMPTMRKEKRTASPALENPNVSGANVIHTFTAKKKAAPKVSQGKSQ